MRLWVFLDFLTNVFIDDLLLWVEILPHLACHLGVGRTAHLLRTLVQHHLSHLVEVDQVGRWKLHREWVLADPSTVLRAATLDQSLLSLLLITYLV